MLGSLRYDDRDPHPWGRDALVAQDVASHQAPSHSLGPRSYPSSAVRFSHLVSETLPLSAFPGVYAPMKAVYLFLACALLTACSSLTTKHEGDLKAVKRIYVEHLLTDNYRTDYAIVEELKHLGYDASCGPLTMMLI